MKKITYAVTALLLFVAQLTYAQNQEKISKIKVTNPDEATMRVMAIQGIDLSCGATHDHDGLTLELADAEIDILKNNNIQFEVLIDDLTEFYIERSRKDNSLRSNKPKETSSNNNQSLDRASVSSVIQDNIIQYTGTSEINWVQPTNFQLGTNMGNCLTISEVLSELDAMDAADTNNIVSARQDASSTSQKTWGNPANTTPNPLYPYSVLALNGMPAFSEPQNYIGQGTSRWNPQTINYVRITGNESNTAENTKPQILFTSMIHSREVSALMNNIYFMWYLIENYGTDPGVTELVDNNELYFVPVVNPDGLRWNEHLSSGGGGSQRKNCRPNTGSTANNTALRGVDLNRNFDYFWNYNNTGSSTSATSNTYRGPYAASEPETQIMVDFILNRNFKTAVWNHSYANSVPHPYGGIPTQASNREDEFYKWHEEMTRFNRYLYGATIFYESNGLPDDWMAGSYDDGVNPPAGDNNGSIGSGQGILGTTPEHGSTGFWPTDAAVYQYAERSMRISFATAYYGGQYAKLHDLTQSNLSGSTADIDFGIERIGQSDSDFTVTVTPISTNITGVTQAGTETGMNVLEQRTVTAQLQLAGGIQPNEKIEYNVKLSNDNGVIYEANYEKYYNPTVLFNHNPDFGGLTGWNNSGWNNTNSAAQSYSGTSSLRTGSATPYASNSTKTLTTTNSYNFSGSSEVLIQFYTKWDLERNYDYVEVLGSTNGTTWQTLSGNYTKPEATSSTTSHDNKSGGATFQSGSGGQIYDGDRMDNWVMEEILIDGSNNSFLVGATNAQIRFNFRSDGSNVSENYSTTSDGFFIDDFKIISVQVPCVESVPTSLNASAIGATSATIGWDLIPSTEYDLRYKESSSGTWIDVLDLTANSHPLTGLTATTQYDVEVRSKCGTSTSAYTATVNFTTTAVNYCASEGNNGSPAATDEWIGNVTIGAINNSTGDDHYTDYTAQSTDLDKNTTPSFSLTKAWSGTNWDEGVAVWIDFNQDGDFEDAGEDVVALAANNTPTVSGNITIPVSALLGNTRMRVSMKYNGLPTSCESFQYGEVEDYTVNIIDPTLTVNDLTLNSVSIFPNPFNESLSVKFSNNFNQEIAVALYDVSGRLLFKKDYSSTNNVTIDGLNKLSVGTYFIKISDKNNAVSITKSLIKQ